MLEVFTHDLRFAVRQLRKSPGFTIAAVLTLGLGIGANTTIFNWANWLFLHPLSGVDTDRLYYSRWLMPGGNRGSMSWPSYLDFKARNRTLEHLSVGRATAFSLGEGAQPERTFGMLVSANYFDLLGARPRLGRTFRPEEDRNPGTHPVAVISYSLWQTKLGADPRVLGRQIRLNTRPFEVIGVMPPGFQGSTVGVRHDIWVPTIMRGEIMGGASVLNERGDRWLETYFRLKPGVSFAQAEQDLNALSAQLSREIFKSDRFARVDAVPIWRHAAGQMLGPVLMLMGAVVALVLLIACANVGNLLLARSAARRREMAVRLALGVGRVRLIRQLLVENALLAAMGAALACATIPFTSGLLTSFAPVSDLAIGIYAKPDWTVFAFTLAVTAAATFLFGFAPALKASRADVVTALKEESGLSGTRSRLRSGLVVAQVALSMLLLVGAGLLLRSLERAAAANPGFDPRNVLVAGVDLLPNGYDSQRSPIFIQQALARLRSLPGVSSVSTVRRVPLGLAGSSSTTFTVDGYTPGRDEEVMALVHQVGPDYFNTISTLLVGGRDLASSDDSARTPVTVINQTLARRYFAKVDPIGRRLKGYGADWTIVGIVKDSKYQSLDEPPTPAFYVPVLQRPASETNFLIRTSGAAPLSIARAVEREIHALDSAMPIYGVRSLEDSIGAAYIPQRMGGWLLGFFGALALILAAVGLSGVLAYSVAIRTREMGIRVALGATPSSILTMIVADGMRLAAVGLTIGLALALLLSRFLVKLLYGVSPTDAVTLASVAVLLAGVALLASLLPARRAARTDPIRAIQGSNS